MGMKMVFRRGRVMVREKVKVRATTPGQSERPRQNRCWTMNEIVRLVDGFGSPIVCDAQPKNDFVLF